MKKLMVVAIAAASCTAFAKMDQTPGAQGEVSPVDPGVYNVSMTYKYLATATQTKSAAQNTVQEPVTSYATEAEALDAARLAYENIVNEQYSEYSDECELVSAGAVKKTYRGATYYTWKISYIAPALTKGVASTKVVSTTVDGLCFVNDINDIQTVLWNKAVKNAWKKIDGYDESEWFDFNDVRVTGDGKADASFHWDNMIGAGTGTAQKLANGAPTETYETVKTLGGNVADGALKTYGTWKFSLDSQSTKMIFEQGKSVDDVLAKKNVELMK